MSPIGEIVNGRRRITTPWHGGSAWRLGKALDTTPDFWANLQTDYDLLTFDPAPWTTSARSCRPDAGAIDPMTTIVVRAITVVVFISTVRG